MKNYVLTKNDKKAFRRLIICFVILAVISAVWIPLSLSQQIHDASVLAFWIVHDQPARAKHNRGRWHAVHTIETINYIIMCLLFVCYAYQFAYIPLAWLPARKRQTPKPDPDHTFAVLIAAHDEATVIGALVSIPLAMREQRTVLGTFRQNWLPFLAGIVLATGLSSLRLSALVNGLGFSIGTALYAFAAGALVISAMVLPGISGSSLLMSCGLYLPVIAAMKDLLHFQFGQFWLLAAVGLGALVGFAVAPHCIRRWMRKAPGAVTYAVLGMMFGSLYAIVVGPTTLKVPQHVMTLSDFHILWFVLGIP